MAESHSKGGVRRGWTKSAKAGILRSLVDVSNLVRVFEASPRDAARLSTGLARHYFTTRHVLAVTGDCSGGSLGAVAVVAHDDHITTEFVMPAGHREVAIKHGLFVPPVQPITSAIWRDGLLSSWETSGEPLARLVRPFVCGELMAWTVSLGPSFGTYAVLTGPSPSSRSAKRARKLMPEVHLVTEQERLSCPLAAVWVLGARAYGDLRIPRDRQQLLRPTDVISIEVSGLGTETAVLLPNEDADAPLLPSAAPDTELEELRQRSPELVAAVEGSYRGKIDLDTMLTVASTAIVLASDQTWLSEVEQAYTARPHAKADRAVLAAAWLFNVEDLA